MHYLKMPSFSSLRLVVGLISCILLHPALASVQTITNGKSLAMSCQQAIFALDQGLDTLTVTDQNDAFICMAYLGGMMATAQHANELAKLRYSLASGGRGDQRAFNIYCFDWQLPYAKIARILVAYAKTSSREHPGLLNQPAHKLALQALQSAFPCR
jgi:hypothetical protein